MSKPNGKHGKEAELETPELEHELPPAENDGFLESQPGAPENQAQPAPDELTKLRAERDALLDRLARLQAEFENARKRSAKEQQDYRDYALTEAVKSLLPILDSFERALAHRENAKEFQSGMELIHKQLADALGKLGVKPVAAAGQPFDPHVHEAVEMVETDRARDNHVLDELQRGYKLKDRLLRPAMVRVARNHKK
jgi:molecular chaperone GrpE